MKSSFQFVNYKIDNTDLKVAQNLRVLNFTPNPQVDWNINLSFRQPIFIVQEALYIGGLDCVVNSSLALKPSTGDEDPIVVALKMGIGGCFKSESRFDDDTEKALVKNHIPTILLPYLRAAITSFLANSGFGTVILPLINLHASAEAALKDVEIKVVDSKSP